MNINIKTVSAEEIKQRKQFSGADWWWADDGTLEVRIEPLSDWKREACLILHEVSEALLSKHNGVTVQQVDDFDRPYEDAGDDVTNTGDITNCPYRREHCFASAIERIMAGELNVPWQDYDDELAGKTVANIK